ncbi:excinuclease ABC subunit UvrA [Candidatus Uhrbacteria bacterium]|nr:excinuclease ABC subunit UvrA [Candidatus Uhrbacteria bacterium]
MLEFIKIRGARVNNLKDIDIDIPHNKLVVFTGLSGSGKSSLAFDTVHAEGQRRFMESLSSFTKQFLENLDKPDVDQIDGLPPTIAIDQRTSSSSPRSTVGTATEIYDYLRLLFARVGTPHCPQCDVGLYPKTRQQIIDEVVGHLNAYSGEGLILAPLSQNEKMNIDMIVDQLGRIGYQQIRLDTLLYTFRELATLHIDEEKPHTLEAVVYKGKGSDHLDMSVLIPAITSALDLGDGMFVLSLGQQAHVFTERLTCRACRITIQEIEPRNFSFNNPAGACSSCAGLGYLLKFDPELLLPNKKLTIAQGAIQPLNKMYAHTAHYLQVIEKAAIKHTFTINTPLSQLNDKQMTFLLYGDTKKHSLKEQISEELFTGIIPYLEEKYKETDSEYLHNELEDYMRVFQCTVCEGRRLKFEMLAVRIGDYSIDKVVSLSIGSLATFFSSLEKDPSLDTRAQKILRPIVKEIHRRVQALIDVGLSYLILDRSMSTLSGGEAQRVKLANHLSSSLVGVVYVLDEPSIGLHPRDTEQLIATLKKLRDAGNTVLVVEHDKHIIMAGDMVIDVGPHAGNGGGEIVAIGTPQDVMKSKHSLTGAYLSGKKEIAGTRKRRTGSGKYIEIKDAHEFNLKHIDVKIPLGKLVFVTGVSGSGKSTLVVEILSKALTKKFYHTKAEPGKHKEILGLENIDKVVVIDQSPIGRTPRSNPVTYTNIFTPIRELYTELPEAKIKGFKPGHFSFNVRGGRCETCQGEGMTRIDMRFLSDVYVECRDCHGKRYTREALEIHYDGLSIADVLHLTVEEALVFFQKHPCISDKLKTLSDVGLGYIHLGQSATTLSGGEAQRIKLAAELSRRSTGKTLYILDEPTTGLHFEDIKQLLNILHQLVDKGNTVLVIEHNGEIIRHGDWIIDMGPEGGNEGGTLVAQGTPEHIAASLHSWTGRYLKDITPPQQKTVKQLARVKVKNR